VAGEKFAAYADTCPEAGGGVSLQQQVDGINARGTNWIAAAFRWP
jgi:hypothetical protein